MMTANPQPVGAIRPERPLQPIYCGRCMTFEMLPTFTPFERSDADYEALAEIATSEHDIRRSSEDMRRQDGMLPKDMFLWREFVVVDGRRVGFASCAELKMSAEPGNYSVGIGLLPEQRGIGYEEVLYARMLERAVERGAKKAAAYAREARVERIAVLERLGFECVQRDPESKLDLQTFEATRICDRVDDVEGRGVVLRTMAEVVAEGTDWMQPALDLLNELMQDVPMPIPPRAMTLDEFRERITNSPFWFPEAWIVAFDGDRWVGSSQLSPMPAQRDTAMTGLTGVVRSHRRRGIATAMKVKALECARKAGVRWVITGNEENNPMLQLNLRLGFREVSAILMFHKDLAP